MLLTETATARYAAIFKYHGPFRGTRRAIEQLIENDLYDWRNGIKTRYQISGEQFQRGMGNAAPSATMHHQPTYASAVRKPLLSLVEPSLKSQNEWKRESCI